jgi:hypothetical protein
VHLVEARDNVGERQDGSGKDRELLVLGKQVSMRRV